MWGDIGEIQGNLSRPVEGDAPSGDGGVVEASATLTLTLPSLSLSLTLALTLTVSLPLTPTFR